MGKPDLILGGITDGAGLLRKRIRCWNHAPSSPVTIQSMLRPECVFSFKSSSRVGTLCPFSYFDSCA